MNSFIQRHQDKVIGQLNGLDRVRFRGTLRRLSYVKAMMGYLWDIQVRLKDFGDYADAVRRRICQATEQLAVERTGHPPQFVSRPSVVKEDLARSLAAQRGISQGLLCILSAVEPCLRRDNCFVRIADPQRAQQLMDQQLHTDWPRLLDGLAGPVNPAHEEIFKGLSMPYYWSAQESEWASDVMFRSAAELSALYPRLLHHGMTTLGGREVLRFLGRKLPAHGDLNGQFAGEVLSDLAERPEGVRIKHRVTRNAIKMYDKHSSVLRVETTINDPVRSSDPNDSVAPGPWADPQAPAHASLRSQPGWP